MQNAGVNEDDEREAMFEQHRPAAARGPAPAPPSLLNPHPLQLKVLHAVLQSSADLGPVWDSLGISALSTDLNNATSLT